MFSNGVPSSVGSCDFDFMQQRRTTIELVTSSKAVLGVPFLVELAYVLCRGLP